MLVDEVKKNLVQLIDNHILVKRRTQTKLVKHFRGSSITDCPRALLFSMMNLDEQEYPKANTDSATGYKLMAHGTAIHELIQGYLIDMEVMKKEDTEKRMEDEELLFAGHCDGILNLDRRVLLEIKTINDKGFQMIRVPKEAHYYQAQAYIHFLNKLYNDDIQEVLFLYINRNSDNLDMKPFWVAKDEVAIATILNKLAVLKQLLVKQELYPIPQGYDPKDSKFVPCRWCPFNTDKMCRSGSVSMQDYPNRKIVAKL